MPNILHYPGDVRNFDPRLLLGPDMYGAHYRIVMVDYDAKADRSTVTLRPIPPKELAEIAEKMFANARPLWNGYRRE